MEKLQTFKDSLVILFHPVHLPLPSKSYVETKIS